jgi:hypothetical protein
MVVPHQGCKRTSKVPCCYVQLLWSHGWVDVCAGEVWAGHLHRAITNQYGTSSR